MSGRERPPVEQQGRSASYIPGVDTPPRPLRPGLFTVVWAVVAVCVAAYATAITLRLAGVELPSVAFLPLIGGLVLARWALDDNARERPPATIGKTALASALVVVAAGCGILPVLFAGQLRSTNPVILIAVWVAIVALLIGALVASYRVRFFTRN